MSSFRSLLGAGDGPALGMFVKIPAPELTEIIAGAGVQFVVIDTEHALLSVREVYEMSVLYAALGVLPLVRVADHGYGDSQRYLDAGVAGLLFPHVSNGAEAAALGRRFTFPPRGTRGMGFASRAGQWGMLPGGRAEYLRFGDDEVMRIAMVEERESVDDIDAILAAEGVDGVFIGPSDLSLSMGEPGKSPAVAAAIDRVIARAVAAGKPVGTVVTDPEEGRKRAAQGCEYLLVGNDTGVFSRALRRSFEGFREAIR
jgi:4-hydroxy-2-oxoheptanedioate aldolase